MALKTTTATRDAFGQALVQLGGQYEFAVLDADLSNSTRTEYFKKEFPDRFIDCGIAEANMIGVAAGMASTGMTVFAASYAIFMTRAFEQIRNSVAYPRLDVKVVGTHAGITVGADGATHQCCEDLALMRVLPNMTVVSPCDVIETMQAVEAMVKTPGPFYLRLSRYPAKTVFKNENCSFELGKGTIVSEGTDAVIFATGIVVGEAVEAKEILLENNINAMIVDISTIKPIDRSLVNQLSSFRYFFTVEEHSIIGGLGSAIAEIIAEDFSTYTKLTRIGLNDCFGTSGEAMELMDYFGLSAKAIAKKVLEVIKAD